MSVSIDADDGTSTSYASSSSEEDSSGSEYSLLEVVHNTAGSKATVHVVPRHSTAICKLIGQ